MVASVQSRLAARIVDAYGGAERWQNASAVDTQITMGGLLLKLKGDTESSLSNLRAHTEIERPYVTVEPIDVCPGPRAVASGLAGRTGRHVRRRSR